MGDERDSGAIALQIRVGTGLELLAGIAALVSRRTAGAWPQQLAGGEALASAIVAETGDTTGELWLHLLAAATDLPGEPDLAAVAGWLAGADPRQLRRVVIGADVPAWRQVVPAVVLEAAAQSRPDAVARLLADGRHYAGQAATALAVLAPLPPDETQRRLVAGFDLARRALPEPLAGELLAAQQKFVRERVRPAGADPLAVLDRVAGFAWTPEAGVRRLVLLPQLAAPGRLLLLQHGDARVVGVPIHTGDQPELAGLAAAFAAVGDEQRLRILQLLSHRELGVSDVARQLGIAKSTAHHHLGTLRRAGLIQLVGQAWRYAYRVRADAPDALAARLRQLLTAPAHSPQDDPPDRPEET
jgi:DNA-binding transcriptional ArsR family regulator